MGVRARVRVRVRAHCAFADAASAPMLIYAQQIPQHAYYEKITQSAERAHPGCAASVRATLRTLTSADVLTIVKELGFCQPLPTYLLQGGASALRNAVTMIIAYSFAGLNMANYPPSQDTGLARACRLFASGNSSHWAAMRSFLQGSYRAVRSATALGGGRRAVTVAIGAEPFSQRGEDGPGSCIDLSQMRPSGANATVTCSDWSGCGLGDDGLSWDLETCTNLVEPIGLTGQTDMFLPPRRWDLGWLRGHCQARFHADPAPTKLVDQWGFDRAGLLAQGASRILFTNGLNDGWSVGGFQSDLSTVRDLLVINMPNGAHHSDLRHSRPCPAPDDTADVLTARSKATEVLRRWISTAMHAPEESATDTAVADEAPTHSLKERASDTVVADDTWNATGALGGGTDSIQVPLTESATCLARGECLQPPNAHGTCRIHTDSSMWSDYPWRNACEDARRKHDQRESEHTHHQRPSHCGHHVIHITTLARLFECSHDGRYTFQDRRVLDP